MVVETGKVTMLRTFIPCSSRALACVSGGKGQRTSEWSCDGLIRAQDGELVPITLASSKHRVCHRILSHLLVDRKQQRIYSCDSSTWNI